MEVVYLGLQQTPESIVGAAVEEDADVIGLSILSGAHMTNFRKVRELMVEAGLGDRLLTGGGIIPTKDQDKLKALGVGKVFGPGDDLQDIVDYIRRNARRTSE
jgi:methylmalonyl-CoA mutase C-terminal domain/subunit